MKLFLSRFFRSANERLISEKWVIAGFGRFVLFYRLPVSPGLALAFSGPSRSARFSGLPTIHAKKRLSPWPRCRPLRHHAWRSQAHATSYAPRNPSTILVDAGISGNLFMDWLDCWLWTCWQSLTRYVARLIIPARIPARITWHRERVVRGRNCGQNRNPAALRKVQRFQLTTDLRPSGRQFARKPPGTRLDFYQ